MAELNSRKLPQEDLDLILRHTAPLWETQRGTRLFITGGTGFFGHWLVESFCWSNDRLNLGCEATLLTRDPERFAAKSPHIANHPAITLHKGDVALFQFPEGIFDTVVHASIDSKASSAQVMTGILHPMPKVLGFAALRGVQQMLFTSSGAVYGPQPSEISHIPEGYEGAVPRTDYGQAKHFAEGICFGHAQFTGLSIRIARCFAFVGPHLPLDANFAIGNFIGDVLANRDIVIHGDGTPLRSYLYGADLAIWLWTILFKPSSETIFNVGAEQAYSISEVADAAAEVAGTFDVKIGKRILGAPAPGPPLRYIPSTQRAQTLLGLAPTVDLKDAIARTLRWHGLGSA
jgi:nucleoside-diphosphate-sugar epimerase